MQALVRVAWSSLVCSRTWFLQALLGMLMGWAHAHRGYLLLFHVGNSGSEGYREQSKQILPQKPYGSVR